MKQIKNVVKGWTFLNFNFFRFGLFFILFFLVSCDGFTGMDGIVKDSGTGEVLEGVKIEMTSFYETINTITDKSGEFHASHVLDGCGIKKCDNSFTIKFEKDGYENLEFKDNYKADIVEIIDGKNIIKLKKIERE